MAARAIASDTVSRLWQIDRRVPAVVVFAVAADAGPVGALAQRRRAARAPRASRIPAGRCRRGPASSSWRSCWTAYGFSPDAPRSNGASACGGRLVHLPLVDRDRAVRLGERRRVLAGALAEDDQVRERVAAEPIGAVQARRRFAGGEQARQRSTSACRRPRESRPSCSASSGPTSIGSSVMSRFASCLNWWYMLGSLRLMWSAALGSFFLIHAMSRNTPPCGLPRPALTSRLMQRAT